MRNLFGSVILGVAVSFTGVMPLQAKPAAQPVASASSSGALAHWAEGVWAGALAGGVEDPLKLLAGIPEADEPGMADLRAAAERFEANVAKREASRAEALEKARKELAEHAEKGEVAKALRNAIEIRALLRDKGEFLNSAPVQALASQALEKAKTAEAEGRWLDAHNLYNHLNALNDESRIYEPDLKRLGQRLVMLRLYTPERLHELRNQQRLAEGEKELPPFNKVGEDWRDKLAGIDRLMVIRAIQGAADMNVEKVKLGRLLIGGYGALRTMTTTTDLTRAFPTLEDASKRDEFIAYLDSTLAALRADENRPTINDLYGGVEKLLTVNARTVQIGESALLHEFGNGAIGELDEFSALIWPDELSQFQRTTEGKFVGVGIQITLNDALELKVVTPLDGTPAQRAGVRPGDLIRKIDGESTLGITLPQAVDRITGKPGTEVTLAVEREGCADLIELKMIRDDIPVYSVKGWERTGPHETDWSWFIDAPSRIGYLRLSQFTKDTGGEMRRALKAMKSEGLRGLILDLRFNPGGLLQEAVNVTSFFAEEGKVVTQEDGAGREVERQNLKAGQAMLAGVPTVVLVNGGSASASEIVSGALQDYKKAVILGERSFGKGSVQQVYSLGPRAAFKLTVQYYRLPNGRLIHRRPGCETWGIEPDVTVEALPKQLSDALTLRQDADVIQFDESGKPIVKENTPLPDARKLITDGLDLQLEAAVLLLKSQTIARPIEQAAK